MIDGLVVGTDGASIVEAFAAIDRFQAKAAAALAEFDRSVEWALDGSVSPQIWLRQHTRMSRGEAGS